MNPTNIEGLIQPKVKHILRDLPFEQFHPVRLRSIEGIETDGVFNGFVAITEEAVYLHFWVEHVKTMPLNTPAEVIARHGEERITAMYAPHLRHPGLMIWETDETAGMVFPRLIKLDQAAEAGREVVEEAEASPAGTVEEQLENFRKYRPECAFFPFKLANNKVELNGFLVYTPGIALTIHTDGYGEMTAMNGEGETILFEYYWGLLRLHVWENINTEDPREYILGRENYVIFSQAETDKDEDGEVVLWSNSSGWVSAESASIFSPGEQKAVLLPMGDARWMTIGELADLLAKQEEARELENRRRWADEQRQKKLSAGGVDIQPLADALEQIRHSVHEAMQPTPKEITLEDVFDAIAQHLNVDENSLEPNVEVDAMSAGKVLEILGIYNPVGTVYASPRRTFTAQDLLELAQNAQRAG